MFSNTIKFNPIFPLLKPIIPTTQELEALVLSFTAEILNYWLLKPHCDGTFTTSYFVTNFHNIARTCTSEFILAQVDKMNVESIESILSADEILLSSFAQRDQKIWKLSRESKFMLQHKLARLTYEAILSGSNLNSLSRRIKINKQFVLNYLFSLPVEAQLPALANALNPTHPLFKFFRNKKRLFFCGAANTRIFDLISKKLESIEALKKFKQEDGFNDVDHFEKIPTVALAARATLLSDIQLVKFPKKNGNLSP